MKHSMSKTKNGVVSEFGGLDYIGAERGNLQLLLAFSEPKTDLKRHYCPEHSLVLFLLTGAIQFTDRKGMTTLFRGGQCVFIAKNDPFDVQIMESLSAILMRFTYQIFMPDGRKVWGVDLDQIEYCAYPALAIPPLMQRALENIMQSQVLLKSANYQRIKTEEMHEIARNCYSSYLRAWFCQSMIRPKDDFKAFLEANFDKVKTCSEMAQMTGMSETPFRVLFRKTFGESVHEWVMKQKAAKMTQLVSAGELDNKRLMVALNFAHGSSYIRFCKQWMGGRPTEVIRRLVDKN